MAIQALSFWPAKWSSKAEYDQVEKDQPERLNARVIDRMTSDDEQARFMKRQNHWLSSADAQRYIYSLQL